MDPEAQIPWNKFCKVGLYNILFFWSVYTLSKNVQVPAVCLEVIWDLCLMQSGSEKNFTFWLWIEGILDLIKRHLLSLWDDG